MLSSIVWHAAGNALLAEGWECQGPCAVKLLLRHNSRRAYKGPDLKCLDLQLDESCCAGQWTISDFRSCSTGRCITLPSTCAMWWCGCISGRRRGILASPYRFHGRKRSPARMTEDQVPFRAVDDFRFPLMRHWTVYDSIIHSRYVTVRLHTWQGKGILASFTGSMA